MSWFTEYCKAAERTDRLVRKSNHAELLACGLFGEAGSVLAELKKERRETEAYPSYRNRLTEEVGDLLWYLVRLFTILNPTALKRLNTLPDTRSQPSDNNLMVAFILGCAAGDMLNAVRQGASNVAVQQLPAIWNALIQVANKAGIDLKDAAQNNLQKIQSRWPETRSFISFFDEKFYEEEQLPRKLAIDFCQIERGEKRVVILRCNGLNLGDRLTDNIENADFYRFHDIFHFAYAVFLGWSPVTRALLKCKRKSDPKLDENQDGARAQIVEEAVSAAVFSRAKEMKLYEGIDHVDYDLLKTIQEFVRDFEVDGVPLWQWETAILQGYRVFRLLQRNNGGRVSLDMLNRNLVYLEP